MSKKKKSRKTTQVKSTKVEVNELKNENIESKQETTKFVTSCLVVVLFLILVTSCFFLDKNMFTFASRETAQTNKGTQQSKIIEQWTDETVVSKCVYSVGFYEGNDPIELSGIENCHEATVIYNDDETKVEVKLGYENVTYKETTEDYVEPSEIEYQENVIETGEKYASIKSIKVNDIDVPVSFFADEYEWLDKLEYMVPIVSRYDNVLVYRIEPRYQLGGYDGVITDVEGNIIKEFTYEQDITYENNKLSIYSLADGQRVCDDVCTSLGNNLCGIDAEDVYMNTITIDTVLAKELETKITTYSEMCTNLGE